MSSSNDACHNETELVGALAASEVDQDRRAMCSVDADGYK